MQNHAFIMPVHKQPKLLARTINILQAENHFFFVHVSGQVENYQEFVDACKELNNIIFVKRIPVYHCGISQVNATIILLDAVISHPVHFDYVHQISGQDYPLRSNSQFDAFFESTQNSFMCYNYEEHIEQWIPVYNNQVYRFHHYGPASLWDKIVVRVGNNLIRRKFYKRRPVQNLAGGWDWFSWSDAVVKYVYDYINSNEGRRLLRRFKYTCEPGEHLWQTILYTRLDELKIQKHFPLRYISWEPYREIEQKHRPYDLMKEDYDRVVNSAAFFCRKVDEVASAEFLDMIDAQRGQSYDISEHDYFF